MHLLNILINHGNLLIHIDFINHYLEVDQYENMYSKGMKWILMDKRIMLVNLSPLKNLFFIWIEYDNLEQITIEMGTIFD
jgi:hypothetical protein